MTDGRHPEGEQGFSAMDFLVAAAIVGILIIVAIPNLDNYRTLLDMKTTARNIASDLRLAQQTAVAKQTAYVLIFATSAQSPNTFVSYLLEPLGSTSDKTVAIPSGITVRTTFTSPADAVQFTSTGTATGTATACTADSVSYRGCICITNRQSQVMTVLIATLTGRVKIYDGSATGCP